MKLRVISEDRLGFTLVELLMVIAISLILAVVAVPIYGSLQVKSQINESTSLLIQNLRISKEKSMARFSDSAHGIKFFSDSYVAYQGNSYSTRTASYDRNFDLGGEVELQWSLSGSGQSDEVNFSKGLGNPDMVGTIEVASQTIGSSKTIEINEIGTVQSQ